MSLLTILLLLTIKNQLQTSYEINCRLHMKSTSEGCNCKMRYPLFLHFMQHRLVVCYGRFVTTCRSHRQGSSWTAWPLMMEHRLSGNVCNKLPICAAKSARRTQNSFIPRRKPKDKRNIFNLWTGSGMWTAVGCMWTAAGCERQWDVNGGRMWTAVECERR